VSEFDPDLLILSRLARVLPAVPHGADPRAVEPAL
jgi:hypothetical protein